MAHPHYPLAIHIGQRVSDTLFQLPCIYSVHKDTDGRLCYLLYPGSYPHDYRRAYSGDWLCQREDGEWDILTDEQYRAL